MGETPFADSGTPEAVKRPKITLLHFILLLVGFGLGVAFSWQNTELFVPEYLRGGGGQGVATCANNLAHPRRMQACKKEAHQQRANSCRYAQSGACCLAWHP